MHVGDGLLQQVADDRFDIAPDVTHLGELGGLDLDEWRLGQPRHTAGDLGLAHAGGTDHEDVLGQHLLAHVVGELLAAEAVAQRNCHRPLGVVLADDEFVQAVHDLDGTQRLARRPFTRAVNRPRAVAGGCFGQAVQFGGHGALRACAAGAASRGASVSTVMLSFV